MMRLLLFLALVAAAAASPNVAEEPVEAMALLDADSADTMLAMDDSKESLKDLEMDNQFETDRSDSRQRRYNDKSRIDLICTQGYVNPKDRRLCIRILTRRIRAYRRMNRVCDKYKKQSRKRRCHVRMLLNSRISKIYRRRRRSRRRRTSRPQIKMYRLLSNAQIRKACQRSNKGFYAQFVCERRLKLDRGIKRFCIKRYKSLSEQRWCVRKTWQGYHNSRRRRT